MLRHILPHFWLGLEIKTTWLGLKHILFIISPRPSHSRTWFLQFTCSGFHDRWRAHFCKCNYRSFRPAWTNASRGLIRVEDSLIFQVTKWTFGKEPQDVSQSHRCFLSRPGCSMSQPSYEKSFLLQISKTHNETVLGTSRRRSWQQSHH